MQVEQYYDQPTITESFQKHIELDSNERILVSSPFGSGKSTFLSNFFDNRENYILLKCYPVNYSVATNEDVFELIKYDLLAEILGRYAEIVKLDDEDFSVLLTAQSFILHRLKISTFAKALLKANISDEGDHFIKAVENVGGIR